jgi:phosphoglucosamine mutase
LFGTDGVRGIANQELTPELAYKLGRAGSYVLAQQFQYPRILVGKDTRVSGDMLEAALVAGICSVGASVLKVGVAPTPAVAYLTRHYEASCGVVISASHNPMEYNGIKFFSGDGFKLPDATEEEIERLVVDWVNLPLRPTGSDVGRVYGVVDAEKNYLDYLCGCLREPDFSGLTVVVDCAHGAAYTVAPNLWRRLGAKVITIGDSPNGININERCGSTHPELLRRTVVEHKANLGVAYDGDADRLIAVDERGEVVDGDAIMVICGLHLKRTRRLSPSRLVATVMSNIGLDIALRREGIEVDHCAVGDRYVLERMQETGARLGGEQSGHLIFLDHATTGDGLLSSLKLVEVMRETGLPLSELAAQMEVFPQILENIELRQRESILEQEPVRAAIARAEERLGEWGKVLVRPSGTEPKIRIMAQGRDEYLLKEVVEDIRTSILAAQR